MDDEDHGRPHGENGARLVGETSAPHYSTALLKRFFSVRVRKQK